tara:strand:+ start:10780 stop:11547 length:768 start_codon:yes stop_codon:yes gene_type:complete
MIMDNTVSLLSRASTRMDLNDWGNQPNMIEGLSQSSGLVLDKRYGGAQESGLWRCTPGKWFLHIPDDEFCYFTAGKATYESVEGEKIDVQAQTAVLFPRGWKGICTVHETMRNTYILVKSETDAPDTDAPESTSKMDKEGTMKVSYKKNPLAETNVTDWGVIPTMIEGQSHISGFLLHKGPKGQSECGLWRCTPGKWDCHVTRDEFCHFLEGRCTYVGEDGQVIEIEPDTIAFFPEGWKGVCTVHETVRKVYMIR